MKQKKNKKKVINYCTEVQKDLLRDVFIQYCTPKSVWLAAKKKGAKICQKIMPSFLEYS